MENSMFLSPLTVILVVSGLALGSLDYCRNHTFDNVVNKQFMHFSKENSEKEFGILYRFKSLHCCTHGYRSIEWFKDGVPYPWSTDFSTLIISPESGNQTIYSQVISDMDSGGYWCIVRNDTHFLRHDVVLKVTESSDLEDPPKPTYIPRDQRVAVGEDAKFYCEAFVGNISLPDAKSEISWRKGDVNNSIMYDDRIKQHIISREGNQILGSYLFISPVEPQDFGHYICRVSNTDDQFLDLNVSLIEEAQNRFDDDFSSVKRIAKVIFFVFSITFTISLVFLGTKMKGICRKVLKNNHLKRINNYDVFVLYHKNDADFAMNKIEFTLQNSYQCMCHTESFSNPKLLNWKDLKEKSKYSKRVIAVLSPSVTDNEWSCQKLNFILQNLISIHPRIIAVFLKSLPLNEGEQGDTLRFLSRQVYCVEYSDVKVQQFWDLMSLGLPAPSVTAEINRHFIPDNENIELV